MPEATVDKHCDAFRRKDNIRSAKEAGLRPKPQAAMPERPPDKHLRPRVAATDT